MQREPEQRSFLDKFQGRNQKVNRDGLLHMLFAKKESNQGTPSKEEALALPLNQYPSHIVKSQSSSKFTPKQKSIFSSQQLHEEREPQSERALDKMAFHLRKQQNSSRGMQNENQFKLPMINRSKSQNSNIISRNGFTPKVEMLESERSSNKKSSAGSFYSKNSDKLTKKMELDEYILRHLEFLDKFEKKLVSNRLSHGSKSFKG